MDLKSRISYTYTPLWDLENGSRTRVEPKRSQVQFELEMLSRGLGWEDFKACIYFRFMSFTRYISYTGLMIYWWILDSIVMIPWCPWISFWDTGFGDITKEMLDYSESDTDLISLESQGTVDNLTLSRVDS